MKRFLVPLVSVLIGVAVSRGLQLAGMAPLYAKLCGLGAVAMVIVADWQWKARA